MSNSNANSIGITLWTSVVLHQKNTKILKLCLCALEYAILFGLSLFPTTSCSVDTFITKIHTHPHTHTHTPHTHTHTHTHTPHTHTHTHTHPTHTHTHAHTHTHTYKDPVIQWRNQEFCLREDGVQQIQLRTEDRENRDLGVAAP